ncbi:hypothetical protein [Pseudomonas fluorescens]|uniref:hypothetical protein n=1 Tax=Pseudomonas fluorescens TaxID=294 RepID=UPI00382C989E
MIDLGATDFYIDVPSLPRQEFEEYSTKLFDEWEAYVGKVLKIPDYALALDVEEGSIKGAAKIAAAVYALYMGVGQYGSFMSGVQTRRGQISSAGEFLAANATAPFSSYKVKPIIKNHNGSLGKLQKLFLKIQQGKITPEQAMIQAQVLFGDKDVSEPCFMDELKRSFENTTVLATQLDLPIETLEQKSVLIPSVNERPLRTQSPKPQIPIGQQFRVQIWRNSKTEKKKVRVVQL